MPRRKKDESPDLIEELVDRLMDHPRTQGILDQATTYFDGFGVLIDKAARRAVTRDHQLETKYKRVLAELEKSRARAQTKPAAEDPVWARTVLGFSETELLTVKKIKARQREFAKIVHPDKGGNTDVMQRYNAAAAMLVKRMGG